MSKAQVQMIWQVNVVLLKETAISAVCVCVWGEQTSKVWG